MVQFLKVILCFDNCRSSIQFSKHIVQLLKIILHFDKKIITSKIILS